MRFYTALFAVWLMSITKPLAQTNVLPKGYDSLRYVMKEFCKLHKLNYSLNTTLDWYNYIGLVQRYNGKEDTAAFLKRTFTNLQLIYTINGKTLEVKPLPFDVELLYESGVPAIGIEVKIKGTNLRMLTDLKGACSFKYDSTRVGLYITGINTITLDTLIKGKRFVRLFLKNKVEELPAFEVKASTGVQDISQLHATGSLRKIDDSLYNRTVTTNVFERIPDYSVAITGSYKNESGKNKLQLDIRRMGKLLSQTTPLIIINNFPWNGDPQQLILDTEDVESITILKDASAASIWGSKAGNGVIVIQTKKPKLNKKLLVSFNLYAIAGEKPDLNYPPIMSPGSYIGYEKYLFGKGYYQTLGISDKFPAFSPVVETLYLRDIKWLSDGDADQIISKLNKQNSSEEYAKYFYRPSKDWQGSLQVQGGNENFAYLLSGSLWNSEPSVANMSWKQKTLYGYGIVKPDKYTELSLFTNVGYSESINDRPFIRFVYPYLRFVDDNGRAMIVPYIVRQNYKDSLDLNKYSDWNYRPLDVFREQNYKSWQNSYAVDFGIKRIISRTLFLQLISQYVNRVTDIKEVHNADSYEARNLYNTYTLVMLDSLFKPIPEGKIVNKSKGKDISLNLRFQVGFNQKVRKDSVEILVGAEYRSYHSTFTTDDTKYGVRPGQLGGQQVDFTKKYILFNDPSFMNTIPNLASGSFKKEYYLSGFVNGTYLIDKRYIASASIRFDASNLYSVSQVFKLPFFSVGGKWNLSKEKFYERVKGLPNLSLRFTTGLSGNAYNSAKAIATATYNSLNSYGTTNADLNNPPNKNLQPEKFTTTNFGMDILAWNNRLDITLDVYWKRGNDLFGVRMLPPNSGYRTMIDNIAGMKGKGIDLTVQVQYLKKNNITWENRWLISYAASEITRYDTSTVPNWYRADPDYAIPVPGKPPSGLFSFKWAGLDPKTGDPRGYYRNAISKAWDSITTGVDPDAMVYSGQTEPAVSASWINLFRFGNWRMSFTIAGKFGYIFRSPSINYSEVAAGRSPGHPDFDNAWKKFGDENVTHVPSLIYPLDPLRDAFYTYSEVHIEKGDHIRLQAVYLSYTFPKLGLLKNPQDKLELYFSAMNLGILWKASSKKLDPDFVIGMPNPRLFALGIRLN